MTWNPGSWRTHTAHQQPSWPDADHVDAVTAEIASLPALVFPGEIDRLRTDLARVADGHAFLLQAGDCAETFTPNNEETVREKLQIILQMAVALTYAAGVPVVKVGRIAGQFAKPRTDDTETRGGTTLPIFRGHIVNDDAFTMEARQPDAGRLLRGYHQSAATLNLLRSFTKGGFADLTQVQAWNLEFVEAASEGQRYKQLADEIERALRFMRACGIDTTGASSLREVDFYSSHEALILPYEEALTRRDPVSGDWYDGSAHTLWLGNRTRQLDGAHVEYLRGIRNPLGIKVSDNIAPADLITLVRHLNPENEHGRITLISRMGVNKIAHSLPPLIDAISHADLSVAWACDPMHGNTFRASSGIKTRNFDDILNEVKIFFSVHRAAGTWPGGLHVELTGGDVTECLGGSVGVSEADLANNYTSICDPRLNAVQSLDLAFRVAEFLDA